MNLSADPLHNTVQYLTHCWKYRSSAHCLWNTLIILNDLIPKPLCEFQLILSFNFHRRRKLRQANSSPRTSKTHPLFHLLPLIKQKPMETRNRWEKNPELLWPLATFRGKGSWLQIWCWVWHPACKKSKPAKRYFSTPHSFHTNVLTHDL